MRDRLHGAGLRELGGFRLRVEPVSDFVQREIAGVPNLARRKTTHPVEAHIGFAGEAGPLTLARNNLLAHRFDVLLGGAHEDVLPLSWYSVKGIIPPWW